MVLALVALVLFAILAPLSRTAAYRRAAGAPGLVLAAGSALALILRITGVAGLPAQFSASAGEALLAALVFGAAAQLRISNLARACPAAFRLSLGGAPLYLLVCGLTAFILVPQLSPAAALVVAATLMLNGGAFDRKAVTQTSAPMAVKAAVKLESAAIVALGAPVAALAAGYGAASGAGTLKPLLDASFSVFAGFSVGGAFGLLAARRAAKTTQQNPVDYAILAAAASFLFAALGGFNPVVAAGACGLIWSEEARGPSFRRIRLRRRVEGVVQPAAYFLFAATFATRLFSADLLTVLFAAAAATVLRAGPRLAMLQMSSLAPESQRFLAWFGGAPGAASALFLIDLLDNSTIADHEAVLSVAALAIYAGVIAARLTSRPLANGFLRELAAARKRRTLAA